MRQYSDIPFAKDVAEYILADKALETLLLEQQMTLDGFMWYAPMLETRYKSIAALIRKSGIKQVLELASGLSLRGLAMTEDPELSYIETDLEALTDEKNALISKLYDKYGLSRIGNHHITVANAMEQQQLLRAAESFKPEQPIAVISEGLLPYLSLDEQETVARNVRGLLQQFGGVWITPDFTLKQQAERRPEQMKGFHRILTEVTGRPLFGNAFEDDEAMQAFFKRLGFSAQAFKQIELVPQPVSEQVLDTSSQQFWEMVRPVLRVWVLNL